MMKPHIALVSKLSQEQQDELISSFDVTLSYFNDRRDALAEEGEPVDIVYGNVRPFELPSLPNLKWIHATWAGIENLCYPELIERNLLVTNVRGASAEAMSEHAITGLLYFLRDIPCHSQANTESSWARSPNHQFLGGSTIMLLGTGGIGKVLASKLAALGVTVIGVNSDGPSVAGCKETCILTEAPQKLSTVDHLISTLPLTPSTQGLLDHTWFAALKPHSIFVNISRGKVVNEADLVTAINSQTIRGAFLDVTTEEPLPDDSPLWNTPNLFITGHRSYLPGPKGSSPAFTVFKENLAHYLAGNTEAMINVIDFEKGY